MSDNESSNASFDTSSEPNASFLPNTTPVDLPYRLNITESSAGQKASYDSGMTRVDLGALRETSVRVRASLKSIEEAQIVLQNALRSLEGCWEGKAADEYVSVYRELLGGLATMYATYAKYPDLLDENAEVREAADAQATMYVAEIELPVWAQV